MIAYPLGVIDEPLGSSGGARFSIMPQGDREMPMEGTHITVWNQMGPGGPMARFRGEITEITPTHATFVVHDREVDDNWPGHMEPLGYGNPVYVAVENSYAPDMSRMASPEELALMQELAKDHERASGIAPAGAAVIPMGDDPEGDRDDYLRGGPGPMDDMGGGQMGGMDIRPGGFGTHMRDQLLGPDYDMDDANYGAMPYDNPPDDQFDDGDFEDYGESATGFGSTSFGDTGFGESPDTSDLDGDGNTYESMSDAAEDMRSDDPFENSSLNDPMYDSSPSEPFMNEDEVSRVRDSMGQDRGQDRGYDSGMDSGMEYRGMSKEPTYRMRRGRGRFGR